MKTRILIAALAMVFGFSTLAHAAKEEFTHVGHNLKAVFPVTTKHIEKKMDSKDGQVVIDIYLCKKDDVVFMMIVSEIENLKLNHKDLKAQAQTFIEGVDQQAKNMKILKRGESDLNKNCPAGYWFLVKHDDGVNLIWLTIENNKLYTVWVQAKSEKDLGDHVKTFLDSVEIEKK